MNLFICPSCGAKLNPEGNSAKCAYCGNVYTDVAMHRSESNPEIENAAKDAISFTHSLRVEVKGNVASITDLWHSIVQNPNQGIDSLIRFYKNLKSNILFCIEAYEKLSDEVKYELGDFVCAQMESIIHFREEHYFIYLDELDDIEAYINQLNYDLGARGIFDFKGKRIIKEKMARANARKTIVLYDYAMQAMQKIIETYNSKLEPLHAEYNATARTALARRKSLKYEIDSLELTKKNKIAELGVQEKTKAYNKVIKKYNITHTDFLAVKREKRKPSAPIPPKKEEVVIDYSAMSMADLVSAIEVSIEKMEKGITRTESDHCKKLMEELRARAPQLPPEVAVYANSVVMSISLIYKDERPPVMKAMLDNMAANIKSGLATLKGAC